ncbi:MAG: hypothetical protein RL757_2127 [Bacteroidota bacterium]|jgi:hypothetical protein
MKQICFGLIIGLTLSAAQVAEAQTASDALRMSSQVSLGTARSMGLNGSMGALGGDFSTLSSNPAGLGVYRKGEFSLSPSFLTMRNESSFKTALPVTAGEDFANKWGFNLGLVATSEPRRSRNWTTVNFGLGVNRVANFSQRFSFNGLSYGSITNRWSQEANINKFDQFGSQLAYETYAIFEDSLTGLYKNDFTSTPNAITQRDETVSIGGGISEVAVSVAGNYRDKLMVGATLGIPIVNYSEEHRYHESDPNGQVPYFEDLKYNYTANTSGVGANLKLGLIYRPIHYVRFGLALHTPTIYSLRDSFSADMSYQIKKKSGGFATYDAASPSGIYEYSFATPWRAMGSVAIVAGKYGFVNADVEYTDYTQPRFFYDGADNDAQQSVNSEIKSKYKAALSTRLGGELAIGEFRLRAGIGYRTSPLQAIDQTTLSYSFGIGIRGRKTYIDLGYRNATNSLPSEYSPYTLPVGNGGVPKIDVTSTGQQVMLTIGFRFNSDED